MVMRFKKSPDGLWVGGRRGQEAHPLCGPGLEWWVHKGVNVSVDLAGETGPLFYHREETNSRHIPGVTAMEHLSSHAMAARRKRQGPRSMDSPQYMGHGHQE